MRLRIGPPVTPWDVEDAERELGRSIPQDFKDVLLGFSGDVEFFWFLPQGRKPPASLSGVFSGVCEWALADLVRINREVAWLAENCFTDYEHERRSWANKFAFQSIANGDFLAIDITESGSQPVVYLSHELGWGHGYRLGPSFGEFIENWTRLGCPCDDIFPVFVPEPSGYLEPGSARAREWCEWFGLPDPTTV
ncbi:SMI1/KNR4 family protein [Paludisphaera rhizosphaerae]|nr:SMI1/KNR4 family protein [Paludisphaera rhizosphaerae]